ncbi:hypothetical protein FQN54_008266 [Arachnomyces sp. PD_36]|nr:hypothetical protein FQN54_008266 [Arachnomyces sp. PD_36]
MEDKTSPLISSISTYVSSKMADHDPSHNPTHVSRVVSLALNLLSSETRRTNHPYDKNIIHLSALLHDIGDRKYLPPPPPSETHLSESERAANLVRSVLLEHGADAELAEKVQVITSNVSYSTECKDPERIRELVREYPELGIVQDADRLDAIGAVGIGRCFTFLGAKGKGKNGEEWELGNAITHFGEKLERLEGMMKTESGREMAKARTERLREFRRWWEEETGMVGV